MIILTNQRVDSCRKCGESLTVKKRCSDCDEPTKKECTVCKQYVCDMFYCGCNEQRIALTV